jgi:hypothetical protein
VTARDHAFVEPAPTGCDAFVDIRRVHTAAASSVAVEMSNGTACSAPSSASHRLARRLPHHPLTATTARSTHRRYRAAVSWLRQIHSPPSTGSGADRLLCSGRDRRVRR